MPSAEKVAAFRKALIDAGGEISEEEAKDLAFQCTKIKRGVRDKIKSGTMLVQELQKTGFVTPDGTDDFMKLLEGAQLSDASRILREYRTKWPTESAAPPSSHVESQSAASYPSVNRPTASSFFGEPVSEKDLRMVSARVVREWRDIGRYLDMEENKIDAIEQDHRFHGVTETSLKLLLSWKSDLGKEATYQKLGDALRRAGRTDVKEDLFDEVQKRGSRN